MIMSLWELFIESCAVLKFLDRILRTRSKKLTLERVKDPVKHHRERFSLPRCNMFLNETGSSGRT